MPAKGKEGLHFPDFQLAEKWLKLINIDAGIFTSKSTWEEVITKATEMGEKVVVRTLALAKDNRMAELAGEINLYLGEEDNIDTADLIFVFGSQNLARIQTAVDLWRQKRAALIMISGGSPFYKQNRQSEAVRFQRYAVEQGVPSKKIIIETKAITVADNVRRGLSLLEERQISYRKMILIMVWYAMRRSWACMNKYIPQGYRVYRVCPPVEATSDFDQECWWKNPNGIRVVFNEFVKMRGGVILNTC